MADRSERLRRLVEERGTVANRDVAAYLAVSPATSHRLLRAFVTSGVLERVGKGRAARYRFARVRQRFRLTGLDESSAWEKVERRINTIRPLDRTEAVSLAYAASEVINNSIDHSGGTWVEVSATFGKGGSIEVRLLDDGIGALRRICEDFSYPSPQEAIVQLEKGKLTSDPANHSGEGLFFSSKAVSRFRLESQGVAWVVDNLVRDSSIGSSDLRKGTRVTLEVIPGRVPRLTEVFAEYTSAEDLEFDKTRTTIKLAAMGARLISRSQAKRVVRRLENFDRAVLDFTAIDMVGQGFCDEVFRIFARRHPEIEIEACGMNENVAFMVARARAAAAREKDGA
jgi:anti-sigma regulatory factor (Ser/Thr protein kinase)